MHPLYWVLIASLLVWGGIFFYLFSMEGRVRRLESRLDTDDRA
jgi:CcmD family protein